MECPYRKYEIEPLILVRCPICDGLRNISRRHVARSGGKPCTDCRKGHVIRREQFYDFWLEQFTPDDVKLIGDAIDAMLGLRVG